MQVLDREVVGVVFEIAAQRFEISRLQRRHERFLVGHVAFDFGERRVDQQSRVIGLRRVLRRNALVLCFKVGDELLVGRIVEVRAPEGSAQHTERGVALRRQVDAVGGRRVEQRHFALEAGLGVLLDEVHPQTARIEHEHGIRTGGLHLRQLGGVVLLLQRSVDLVDQRRLVIALETGDVVLAALIVGRQRDDALVAFVGRVLPHDFRLLVVLPRGGEEERRALGAGDWRRPGVRADQKHLLVGDLFVDRHHHVGEGHAGDDRHFVALDQLVDDLHRHFRLELAVFLEDLHWNAAELAAVALHHQHEGIVLILAQCALRPRQFCHEADFQGGLRLRCEGCRA